jgi:hypothetical protein
MNNKRLPDFLIIGAQKSASTFIHLALSEHPDIFIPEDEIPHFESPDYQQKSSDDLSMLFKDTSATCLGIRRPSYIGLPEVPARIEKDLPNAKLIAVLRDPTERAISAYFHNINYGFIPPLAPEIGLQQLLRKTGIFHEYKRSQEVLEFGLYHKYLKQYSSFSSKDNLLILFHEDIKNDPLKAIHKAYQFLEVDPYYAPHCIKRKPQQVIYNLTRLKVLSLRNHVYYHYNETNTRLFPKSRNPIRRLIMENINLLDQWVLSKLLPNQKIKLSTQLRQDLSDFYKNDRLELEAMTGRNLTNWCKV